MVWSFLSQILVLALLSSAQADAKTYRDFPKVKASVGSAQNVTLFLALNESDRELGLMNVQSLPKNDGVLFVFEKPEALTFWMKNTFVPLTIGYYDENGCLVKMLDMKPVTSVMQLQFPRYRSESKVQFALEMNQGWFSDNKVSLRSSLVLKDLKKVLSQADLPPAISKALNALSAPRKCPPMKDSGGN
ncbi:DUF192 domain-containing protein [bacterium]|nr:DUF192 domain-containing protein [bacterium]